MTPYAGNDGGIATLQLQTTSAGGITLTIASTSDSNGTFNPATGRFSGSLHTPNHATGTMEGSFAKDCTGYRIQTKTAPANGGSYTETEWGYQGGLPRSGALSARVGKIPPAQIRGWIGGARWGAPSRTATLSREA